MKKNAKIGSIVLGGVLALGLAHGFREPHSTAEAATIHAAPRAESASPARATSAPRPTRAATAAAWREEALEEADILNILESGWDFDDMEAALVDYFRRTPWEQAMSNEARWRSALLRLLNGAEELPPSLAARLGRLLRDAGNEEDIASLEDAFRSGNTSEARRMAALEASASASLQREALSQSEQSVAVKETAVRRLADMGQRDDLRGVLGDEKQPAAVRISTLHALSSSAEDLDDVQELVVMGSKVEQVDEFGRSAMNVARVAAAEARVGGKSQVIYEEWTALLDGIIAGTARATATEAMVASIAFAHALWSDPDRATVGALLTERLLPDLTQRLQRSKEQKQSLIVQVLVEFAATYHRACEVRPLRVCDVPDEPRVLFRGALDALLAPYLREPELAEMAQRFE